MLRRFSTEHLARVSATNPWRTLFIWLMALIAGAIVIATLLPSATTTDQDFTFDVESKKTRRLLAEWKGPEEINEVVVFYSENITVDDPRFRSHVESFTASVIDLGPEIINYQDGTPKIANFYITGNEMFVSDSRNSSVMTLGMAGSFDEANENIKSVLDLTLKAESSSGIKTTLAGPASISSDFKEAASEMQGEIMGIAAAIVILLLVFRAVGAAWIPIFIASLSIGLAVALASIIGQFYKLAFFVIQMITMIGLAVGIDYSLFIIARYREERAQGLDKIAAISVAGSTASRSVFFSGLTVVFALLGMVIVPTSVFFSLGLGAILVVIVTVLAALTLLPAILSLLDQRVNAWRIPFLSNPDEQAGTQTGFWNRITNLVMAYPWPALIVVGGLLVAATVPFLGIRTGASGISALPDSFRAKQAYVRLESEFPHMLGGVSFADIVIEGDAGSYATLEGIQRLQARLAEHPIFHSGEYEVSQDGNLGLLTAVITVDANSNDATDAVRDLRDVIIPESRIPSAVYVGGGTALNIDFVDLANLWTPIVITLVLSLSFILLTVVFRSLIVPIKAILLNLLSVGAAYGILTLVIQNGFLIDLFGFQQVEAIEAWMPIFLFSILFGLSMDYEVFLLSRIRERYGQTGLNRDSVAFGLQSTAAIITGAALIMVAVFFGFALSELTMFQQMGFGLGVAILVDATVIRAVLVPATMRLLGDRNWYLPSFLQWLPEIRVDRTPTP